MIEIYNIDKSILKEQNMASYKDRESFKECVQYNPSLFKRSTVEWTMKENSNFFFNELNLKE